MKPKTLLVEDNENNRYLAQFLLEREGFAVTVAVNGKQALEAARLNKPDLVVMDIQMPEMDGYETAERFKSDPTLRRHPAGWRQLLCHARRSRQGVRGWLRRLYRETHQPGYLR